MGFTSCSRLMTTKLLLRSNEEVEQLVQGVFNWSALKMKCQTLRKFER